MSVICFRHPHYDGSDRPVLSCPACCALFIGRIKERIQEGSAAQIDTSQWVEDKRREAAEAGRRHTSGTSSPRPQPLHGID